MNREEQLAEARREEAQTLFRAGQGIKERTDRILGLGLAATGVAATAGIANNFAEVMLAIPVALSLLMAFVFQLYADMIALGIARGRIESVLRDQLGDDALIAEMVAPARHGGRTNPSLPLTQAVYVLLLIGSAVAGAVIASDVGTWPLVGYLTVTLLTMAALLLSWRDLGRTWHHASRLVAPYGARGLIGGPLTSPLR